MSRRGGRRFVVVAATVLTLVATACGGEGSSPETGLDEDTVHVADAWAIAAPEGAAVYFGAHNGAEEEDRLIGVSSPEAGRAEVQETAEQGDQLVMQPVEAVAIGPDEWVRFEPGGYHIMLFDLASPLETDSTITVVLEFDLAGQVPIEALVRESAPDDGIDMGSDEMDHEMDGATASTGA
jgi:copper(I)-binding protein